MRLTVHRGTKEIGGNCIEVATDSTRIILDVGKPLFDADRKFDDSVLRDKSVEELLQAYSSQRRALCRATPDAILPSCPHGPHRLP